MAAQPRLWNKEHIVKRALHHKKTLRTFDQTCESCSQVISVAAEQFILDSRTQVVASLGLKGCW